MTEVEDGLGESICEAEGRDVFDFGLLNTPEERKELFRIT
jgi:hypothetical protein